MRSLTKLVETADSQSRNNITFSTELAKQVIEQLFQANLHEILEIEDMPQQEIIGDFMDEGLHVVVEVEENDDHSEIY
jgi:hypothetical protein